MWWKGHSPHRAAGYPVASRVRTWAACPNSLNPGSRFILPRIPELFSAPHLGSSRNSSPIPSLFACLSVQFL